MSIQYAESDLLFGARLLLRKEGERVEIVDGRYFVGGVEQTPEEVIAYAEDLRRAERGRPLSPHSGRHGRPKRGKT